MARGDCLKSMFGTSFHAKYWLSLNPAGLCCVSLSLSIHIFSLCTIWYNLIQYSIAAQIIFGVLYVPAAAMALANLFMAWSTNPGAVPIGARPLQSTSDDEDEENDLAAPLKANAKLERSKVKQRGIRRCRKCNGNYKPPRSHHDSVTGRCIVKMDHFCPWVGNAVGALNHKFFFLFIFYTMCTSLTSLILLALRYIRCGFYHVDPEREDDGDFDIHSYIGCDDGKLYSPQVIVLLTVSITFLIFTACMLCEQIDAIQSNTSKIARMKISMGEGAEEYTRVTSEFNEMFGGTSPNVALHWFLPTSVRFPDNMNMMRVMGYEFRDEWNGEIYRETQSGLESSSGKASSSSHSLLVISECDGDEEQFVASGSKMKRDDGLDALLPDNDDGRMPTLDAHPMKIEDAKHRGNMKIA